MDKKRDFKKPEENWEEIERKIVADSTKELEAKPGSSEAYFKRGHAYYNLGEFNQAARDIEKIVKLEPGNLEKRRFLSVIYSYNGDSSKQISCATQILKIKPDAGTYYLRGIAYYMKKKYTLAVADFNKSIKLEDKIKHTAYAHNWLGGAYFNLGKDSKGIASHREAARLNPGTVIYYTDWAMDCFNAKKYDEAINTITVGIKHNRTKHNPEGALLYVHRGLAYEEKSEYRKAINDFKKTIEFDPQFKGYRSNLNRVLQKAKLKSSHD